MHRGILAAFIMLAPFAANADESAAPDSLEGTVLPGIVIRAQRIPARLQNTPEAAHVLQLGFSERGKFQSLDQLVRALPGIRSHPTGNPWGQAHVSVRGFYGGSQAQYLRATLDGLPLNDLSSGLVDWSSIDVDDLERVEAIKGPTSAQYGDFGFGGLIALYTPSQERSPSRFSVAGGSDDALRIGGQLQASSSKWGGSLSASHRSHNGWRQHSAYTSNRALIRGTGSLGREDRLTVIADFASSDEERPGALTRTELSADRTAAATDLAGNPLPDRRGVDQLLLGVSSSLALSKAVDLLPRLYWRRSASQNIQTIDTSLNHDPETNLLGAEASVTLESSVGDRQLRIVSGLTYEHGWLSTAYWEYAGSGTHASSDSMLSGGHGRRQVFAAYAHGVYEFLDPLFLSLGLRLDGIRTSFDYEGRVRPDSVTHQSTSEEQLTPRIGLGAALSATSSLFASVSGAFKAPTLTHLYDAPPVYNPWAGDYISISNHTLQSQEGTCLEIGARTDLETGALL